MQIQQSKSTVWQFGWLFVITVFIIVTTTTQSCYYDKEDILYPESACDTASITYSRSIVPILTSNCNSCHGGNTPSAGIRLDAYAGVKTQVDNGKLWGAVSHTVNFSPMPKNGSKLNTCNLTKIKKWIDAGAPNN
jgi:hypothetical protein